MDDLLTPDNLPVRFQGTDRDGLPALDDVSLTIRRGQFLVVVGPSGYGKSTPPRAVARLILGTSGSVTRDPATKAASGWFSRILPSCTGIAYSKHNRGNQPLGANSWLLEPASGAGT